MYLIKAYLLYASIKMYIMSIFLSLCLSKCLQLCLSVYEVRLATGPVRIPTEQEQWIDIHLKR